MYEPSTIMINHIVIALARPQPTTPSAGAPKWPNIST